jgi:hypothetical protein
MRWRKSGNRDLKHILTWRVEPPVEPRLTLQSRVFRAEAARHSATLVCQATAGELHNSGTQVLIRIRNESATSSKGD